MSNADDSNAEGPSVASHRAILEELVTRNSAAETRLRTTQPPAGFPADEINKVRLNTLVSFLFGEVENGDLERIQFEIEWQKALADGLEHLKNLQAQARIQAGRKLHLP